MPGLGQGIGMGLTKFLVGVFKSLCSFLFDGVNEYLTIPKADLEQYFSGSNKSFSINTVIKRNSIGSNHTYSLSNWGSGNGFLMRIDSANPLRLYMYNSSGISKNAYTVNTFTSTTDWYSITVVFDHTKPLGSRIIFMVNGINEVTASDTIEADMAAVIISDFKIAAQGTSNIFDGYINQVSVIDRAITLLEHQDWYKNGKPKNPQKVFGTNCVYFMNPSNGVWNGFDYITTDAVNSITATSTNMEEADKDCTINPYLL